MASTLFVTASKFRGHDPHFKLIFYVFLFSPMFSIRNTAIPFPLLHSFPSERVLKFLRVEALPWCVGGWKIGSGQRKNCWGKGRSSRCGKEEASL